MKTIELTQGKEAIVDDEMYPLVSSFKWTLSRNSHSGICYAYRNMPIDKKITTVHLHHVITGRPLNGLVVDHINGDGLDNRKENLRVITSGENIASSRRRKAGMTYSKFLGVTWHKLKKRWYSSIRIGGKTKFLGTFRDEIAAANAYQRACGNLKITEQISDGR